MLEYERVSGEAGLVGWLLGKGRRQSDQLCCARRCGAVCSLQQTAAPALPTNLCPSHNNTPSHPAHLQTLMKHVQRIAQNYTGEDKEEWQAAAKQFRLPYLDW